MPKLLIAATLGAALAQGPELPRVLVTADVRAPSGDAWHGARTVRGAEALERPGARDDAAGALRGIAGLTVRDRRNAAQDLQLSSRGFGARSSFGVRGLRLYVNGVPATAADGQGQLSHALVDRATRIEVERGPVAALYGNAAGAVVRIDVDPAAWPERAIAHAAADRDAWRASATAALHGGRGDALVVASRAEIDGFRPHSSARRDQLDAVAGGTFGAIAWRASANVLEQPEVDDPLGLTRAQFDADPDSTAPQALAFDTRKSVRQRQVGVALESIHDDRGWAAGLHGGAREVVQYLAVPAAPQSSPAHAGGVIDLERGYGGVDARAWRSVALGSARATATIGVHVERLDEHRRGYENFVGTRSGVRGALRRDEDNATDARDAYARLDVALSPRWSALAGVRASRVSFDSDDRYVTAANPDDSGARRFSDTGVLAGLAHAWRDDVRAHVAWGEGFESPTANELAYRPDGASGLNGALDPARNRQLEAGLRVTRAAWNAALTVYRVDTDDEIVTAANQGGRASFRNAGRTRRDGVEAELELALGEKTRMRASASVVDARFRDPYEARGEVVQAGNRLPGVPRREAWLELRHEVREGLTLGALAEHVGEVAVDDVNRDAAAAATTLDAWIARDWTTAWGSVGASLRLANAFDRRYAGSVIVNEANGRWFEPAPGRRLVLTVDVAFD